MAQQAGIVGGREGYGIGGLAIAPGAPGLLEVLLERAGDVDVYNEAHVGLVDAHAEGVGGDHDAQLAGHPSVLPLGLHLPTEPGVKEGGREACGSQRGGYLGCATAAADVDDGGSTGVAEYVDEGD